MLQVWNRNFSWQVRLQFGLQSLLEISLWKQKHWISSACCKVSVMWIHLRPVWVERKKKWLAKYLNWQNKCVWKFFWSYYQNKKIPKSTLLTSQHDHQTLLSALIRTFLFDKMSWNCNASEFKHSMNPCQNSCIRKESRTLHLNHKLPQHLCATGRSDPLHIFKRHYLFILFGKVKKRRVERATPAGDYSAVA